ncbi:MAG: Hsp33 family molecular chaperone HslO [Candidatus Cloacimonetes bacterium]|nr:Hsp33 family molecular chaperone HslO [Candidatus Cloacimonadota bacterium]
MPDKLTKGISSNKEIRYFTADISNTAEEGRKIHDLSPVKTVIFGKLLCAGLLLGADLKEKDYLVSIKVELKESSDFVLVTANKRGEVKGYPHLSFKDDISTSEDYEAITLSRKIREKIISELKDGIFTVIKDIGLKNPYNGSSKLITGELARDITYYFTVSEQIPSIVGLSVILNPDGSVKKAVGFLVQLLPEASNKTIDHLEKNMQKLPEIIDLLEMGKTIQNILSDMIFKGIPIELNWESEARYHCDCSKERFEKGLILLSKDELKEVAEADEIVKIQCHYCNKDYEFNAASMKKIIKAAKK